VRKIKVLVDSVDRVVNIMTRNALRVAIAMLIVLTALVVLEVILRRLLGFTLQITVEYSAYLYCSITILGLAITFRTGNHLRVEILLSRLGSKARQYADLFACVLGITLLSLLFWYTLNLTITSCQFGTLSQTEPLTIAGHDFLTPLWIPQVFMPLGVSIILLEVLVHTVKLLFKFKDSEGITYANEGNSQNELKL